MPNWVTNRLMFDGPEEDIQALAELLNTRPQYYEGPDQEFFNFEAVVPMPADPRICEGPQWRDEGVWALQHWGTKKIAFHAKWQDHADVVFDTAWTSPLPLVEALSRKFPRLLFLHCWADEDFGLNTGEYKICGGEVVWGGPVPDNSPRARLLALELTRGNSWDEDMGMCWNGRVLVFKSELRSYEEERRRMFEGYPAEPEMELPLLVEDWERNYTVGEVLRHLVREHLTGFTTAEALADHIRGDAPELSRDLMAQYLVDTGFMEDPGTGQ